MERALIRLRMSSQDARYAGNLVAAGRIMELFGDAATELLIRRDGDEGLLLAYHSAEFRAPVFAGDFLEVEGRITEVGNTSRRIELEARKVITLVGDPCEPSAADVLAEPVVVARATCTCVVPRERQRKGA